MSLNFAGFETVAFVGTPYSQPITIGQKPVIDLGPKTARIEIDWMNYGASSVKQQLGVFVNLYAQSQVQGSALDAVRSVYIDNTYSNVPVYIVFPDTLFTIVCPAYSVVMSPVFTNVQQFTIYGDGFQSQSLPKTTLFFSNIDRQGYYVPASLSGAPTTPIILRYLSSVPATLTGNINLTNIDIGEADDDRIIVCVTQNNSHNNLYQRIISALVMGGVAASEIIAANYGQGDGTNVLTRTNKIWVSKVPTGTTMSVAVTVTGAGPGSAPALFSFYSIRNVTHFDAYSSGRNQTASLNPPINSRPVSLQVRKNGALIVSAFPTQSGFLFTNANPDYAENTPSMGYLAVGSALTVVDGDYIVTGTNCGAICAASFY